MILSAFRRSDFILLGGILGGMLYYAIVQQSFSLQPIEPSTFFYLRLFFWLWVLLLYLYARLIEKGDFNIWKDRPYKIWYSMGSIVILYLLYLACSFISLIPRVFGWHEKETMRIAMGTVVSKNMWLLVFTALTAGVTEELIFRAYLLPRLQVLFCNKTSAIVVSALMFSAAHYRYRSLEQSIFTFIFGIVFAVHYQKYRNIKILIIAHTLVDLIAFLAFWLLHVKLHLPIREPATLF